MAPETADTLTIQGSLTSNRQSADFSTQAGKVEPGKLCQQSGLD